MSILPVPNFIFISPLERNHKMLEIHSDDDWHMLLEFSDKLPIVIDWYASWCNPCKKIAPLYEEYGEKFANQAIFYRADVDDVPDLAVENDVSALPTLMILLEKRVVWMGQLNEGVLGELGGKLEMLKK